MHDMARRFTDTLDQMHRDREVDGLVALFAEDATLSKSDTSAQERGQDGARSFWTAYREVLDDIDVRQDGRRGGARRTSRPSAVRACSLRSRW